jgi:hypothetical protein
MAVKFQVVIDCKDPARMCQFWPGALGYEMAPPPNGFESWDEYWRDLGVPDDQLGSGPDRLIDPSGRVPPIWFQVVDETKTVKNRVHFDLGVSGGRSVPFETRKLRVEAEAARLSSLGATRIGALFEKGIDHYAVAMLDPEGNEFDINGLAET